MSYLIWYGITSVLCSCCYALGAIVAARRMSNTHDQSHTVVTDGSDSESVGVGSYSEVA